MNTERNPKIDPIAWSLDLEPSPDLTENSLDQTVRGLRRHAGAILRFLVAFLLVGVVFDQLFPKHFTSKATIYFAADGRSPVETSGAQPAAAPDTALIDSQVELLRSGVLALKVIDDLDLQRDSKFLRESGVANIAKPLLDDAIAAVFAKHLKIDRIDRTYVLSISYTARSAAIAEKIARGYATSYIAMLTDDRVLAERQGSEWLRQHTEGLRQQANKSDLAFREALAAGASSENAAKVNELAQRAENDRKLFEAYLQRSQSSMQSETWPTPNARIITYPDSASTVVQPRHALVLAMSAFLGLLSGFGFAAFREYSDRSVRTAEQVRRSLRKPVLGLLPRMSMAKPGRAKTKAGVDGHPIPSEAYGWPYRAALNALMGNLEKFPANGGRIIGVTSVLAGEGRTTIALALAALAAESGKRVLLIDADAQDSLSEPTLQKQFGSLLANGGQSGPTGAAEVVNLFELELTPDAIEDRYDYVFVDLPPLGFAPRVMNSLNWIKEYLIVVKWGETWEQYLQNLHSSDYNIWRSVTGAVMNDVDLSRIKLYGGVDEAVYLAASAYQRVHPRPTREGARRAGGDLDC